MKYKVGDRVKIKEDSSYTTMMKSFLICHNYIFTISAIPGQFYHFKEFEGDNYCWTDEDIVGMVEKNSLLIENFINNRFEILDL